MKRTIEDADEDCSFSDDQRLAIDAAVRGDNVCILGPAGTGKSFIINTIRAKLLSMGKQVAVVAPTGIAATAIGGSTIHSWAGVGLAKEPVNILVRKVNRFTSSKKRWKETGVLIIDEISMVHPDFFEKLSVIGKSIRRDQRPFGGIQLILVGDFFQLPPVSNTGSTKYLFESQSWNATVKKTVLLSKIFRQQDPVFMSLLDNVRNADMKDAELVGKIKALSTNKLENDSGIKPTILYCRTIQVDQANQCEFDKVEKAVQAHISRGDTADGDGNSYFVEKFNSTDWFMSDSVKNKYEKTLRLSESIKLCNGTQAMLNWNLDVPNGRTNGARCVVLGFVEDRFVKVRFLDGSIYYIEKITEEIKGEGDCVIASRTQYPLRYAWSMTVHKSQGMSIDLLSVDLSGSFCDAMVYVALSRGRTLENMRVLNFHPNKVTTSEKVKAFYASVANKKNKSLLNKRVKLGAISME